MNIDSLDNSSPQQIARFIDDLDDVALTALDEQVRADLALMGPVPNGTEDPYARRRRTLRWLSAHAASRAGDNKELHALHLEMWGRGEPCIPIIEFLRDVGDLHTAAVVAQMAWFNSVYEDVRDEVKELWDSLDEGPAHWERQLARLAESPTMGGWRSLMRFVPEEDLWQATRRALNVLERHKVDDSLLFRFATEYEVMTNHAQRLIWDGRVAPETVLERNHDRPTDDGQWYGWAAHAAYARGDKPRALALIREAMAKSDRYEARYAQELHDEYDDEMTALLMGAGIYNKWDDDVTLPNALIITESASPSPSSRG